MYISIHTVDVSIGPRILNGLNPTVMCWFHWELYIYIYISYYITVFPFVFPHLGKNPGEDRQTCILSMHSASRQIHCYAAILLIGDWTILFLGGGSPGVMETLVD